MDEWAILEVSRYFRFERVENKRYHLIYFIFGISIQFWYFMHDGLGFSRSLKISTQFQSLWHQLRSILCPHHIHTKKSAEFMKIFGIVSRNIYYWSANCSIEVNRQEKMFNTCNICVMKTRRISGKSGNDGFWKRIHTIFSAFHWWKHVPDRLSPRSVSPEFSKNFEKSANPGNFFINGKLRNCSSTVHVFPLSNFPRSHLSSK